MDSEKLQVILNVVEGGRDKRRADRNQDPSHGQLPPDLQVIRINAPEAS